MGQTYRQRTLASDGLDMQTEGHWQVTDWPLTKNNEGKISEVPGSIKKIGSGGVKGDSKSRC